MWTNQTDKCWFVVVDRLAVEQAYFSYIINIVLNSLFSLPTILFNLIVIISIWRTASLHTPSNLLICSLSVSDLLLGLVTQPFYVAYKCSEINDKFGEYCKFGVQIIALLSSYFLAGASFFTLTAMSLDRCLALHLGLRYRCTVTQARIIKVIVVLWMFAAFLGSMQTFLDLQVFFKVVTSLMLLCLSTTTVAYVKAYTSLRRHHLRVCARENTSGLARLNQLDKYRKSLRAVKYLLALILLCYVPHTLVYIAIATKGLNAFTRAAKNIANPIVFANSCINPVIYWWKLKDIRQACKDTLQTILPVAFRESESTGGENESQLSATNESTIRRLSRNRNIMGTSDSRCAQMAQQCHGPGHS